MWINRGDILQRIILPENTQEEGSFTLLLRKQSRTIHSKLLQEVFKNPLEIE